MGHIVTLLFEADEQQLKNTSSIDKYASDTIKYVEAIFSLNGSWSDFDIVKAVWVNNNSKVGTILDGNGHCYVPAEVLAEVGAIKVNLVGSNVVNDIIDERLTTYPIVALTVSKKVALDGTETAPVTPSQFEQFVANVKADADRSESAMRESEAIKTEVEGLKSDVAQLKSDTEQIKTDTESLVNGFDANVSEALDDISEAKTDALDGISSAKTQAVDDVTAEANTQKTAITQLGTTQKDAITSEGARQIGLVTEEGTDQVEAVQNEGQTQVNTVRTEGGTQRTAIEQKGADVLSRIPYFAPVITDTAEGSIASFTDGADDYPMKSVVAEINPIQAGSGDSSPTNIRPIKGWDGVEVNRTGRNLCKYPYDSQSGTYNGVTVTVNADGSITFNGTATSGAYFDITNGQNEYPMPKGTYVLHKTNSADIQIIVVKNRVYWGAGTTVDKVLTSSEDFNLSFYVYIRPNIAYSNFTIYPMFELGSTATAYEPYQGTSKSIPFKDENGDPVTVYGGEIDVVKGEGEETNSKPIHLKDLTWISNSYGSLKWEFYTLDTDNIKANGATNIISNMFKTISAIQEAEEYSIRGYAHRGALAIGLPRSVIQTESDLVAWLNEHDPIAVYELATPTPIYCEPTEVKSIKGNNNIWADTGDISVEYPADTKLYIDRKIGTNTRTFTTYTSPAVVSDATEEER